MTSQAPLSSVWLPLTGVAATLTGRCPSHVGAHLPFGGRRAPDVSGQRGISADTARRLALFFGVEPWVFVERLMVYDLEQLGPVHVEPADVDGFLVGPQGVMLIPRPTREAAPLQATVSPALLARLRAQEARAPESAPRGSVETTYASGQRAMVSKAR